MTAVAEITRIAQSLDPEALAVLLENARLLAGIIPDETPADLPIIPAGSPIPESAKAGGWIESKMIPKKNGKLYGPYFYVYRWDPARKNKKFVKYLGRDKRQQGGNGDQDQAAQEQPETAAPAIVNAFFE